MAIAKKICTNCHKQKTITQFYNSRSKLFEKDGKLPICKKCLKEMIDYNDIQTVYNLLKQLDIPYLYMVWNTALKNKGDTLGNYIRQINSLPQYEELSWKDSDFTGENKHESNTDKNNQEKIYSKQWMGDYTENEIEYLDNYYEELKSNFKIVTVNHKDYAKKIAKASLAMDKAYEGMLNGEQGADKRYKDLKDTFDQLSKSAQFSENTRGANDAGLGCFGTIFDRVEQKKWIPKHNPIEKDDIDKMIDAFTSINKSL